MKGLLPSVDYNPCVYVEFDISVLCWKIGIKSYTKAEEYSLQISNEQKYRSLDFALNLLELYKKGGKKAVEQLQSILKKELN
jgi:hypothetical protein